MRSSHSRVVAVTCVIVALALLTAGGAGGVLVFQHVNGGQPSSTPVVAVTATATVPTPTATSLPPTATPDVPTPTPTTPPATPTPIPTPQPLQTSIRGVFVEMGGADSGEQITIDAVIQNPNTTATQDITIGVTDQTSTLSNPLPLIGSEWDDQSSANPSHPCSSDSTFTKATCTGIAGGTGNVYRTVIAWPNSGNSIRLQMWWAEGGNDPTYLSVISCSVSNSNQSSCKPSQSAMAQNLYFQVPEAPFLVRDAARRELDGGSDLTVA